MYISDIFIPSNVANNKRGVCQRVFLGRPASAMSVPCHLQWCLPSHLAKRMANRKTKNMTSIMANHMANRPTKHITKNKVYLMTPPRGKLYGKPHGKPHGKHPRMAHGKGLA